MPKRNTTVTSVSAASSPLPADAPALPPAAQIVLALLDVEAGTTATDLSERAGLARSTVTKSLSVLLDHGLATREEGGHEGARRIADRWFAAPGTNARQGTNDGDQAQALPEAIAPDGVAAPVASDSGDGADPNGEAAEAETIGETTDDGAQDAGTRDEGTPAAEDGSAPEQAERDLAEPADAGSQDPEAPDAESDSASDSADKQSRIETDAADGSGATPGAAADADADAESSAPRLGKGELRAMVEGHLRANGERAWTPTAISNALNRSAGAINNACLKLAETGAVTTLPGKPTRFQWNGAADADAS